MDRVNTPASAPRASLRAERAGVTRRRIADAARRLFARDGYGATTLQGIAAEAGVAVQTVYAVYGSKAGILHELRRAAMVLPEAEEPLAMMRRTPSARGRLELFAGSIRLRWERAGDIVLIHRDAAAVDPGVRAGVEETVRARRAGIAGVARSLAPGLRPDLDVARAAAILDALTLPEVFVELVEVQGWTADAYERWLAAALARELLDTDDDPARPAPPADGAGP